MNLKQLGILVAVVLVVGAAGLILHNKQNTSWAAPSADVGKKLLGDFPVNDVAHIEIQHGGNELNLVKKDDLWRVSERQDYPASFSQISDFLLKARDLKIIQSEEIGQSQLGRMELAPGQGSNSAVVVNFMDQNGKSIRTLVLGKRHIKTGGAPGPSQFGGDGSFPDGRYVAAGTNSPSVALVSDPLDNVGTQADQWIDKDFFHVDKPKSIEVDFGVATNSWKLTRPSETADWNLADAKPGEELDSAKTSGVTSPFGSISFTDVLPGTKLNENGTNKLTSIQIHTFDGFSYTVTVGPKVNDNYLLTVAVNAEFPKERVPGKDEKPEDKAKLDKEYADAKQKLTEKLKQEQGYEKWIYTVPSWAVDPVLKERGELLAEKKEEPKESNAAAEKPAETNQVQTTEPAAVH
jgi:hypothetical protein